MRITIDTETTSKDPNKAELVTAQVTADWGTLLITRDDTTALKQLYDWWDDPTIEKCFQNGSYDIKVLERLFGKQIQGYAWDTMLAEHLLHEETNYNLELLRGIYTDQPVYEQPLRLWKAKKITIPNGVKTKKVKTKVHDGYFKTGREKFKTVETYEEVPQFKTVKRGDNLDGYADVPPHILHPYGVYDSQTEHMVWHKQEQLFSTQQKELLQEVSLPMQLALKDMEREGIAIDVDRVPIVRQYYEQRAKDLEQEVYKHADEEFKITSPDEVKRVLFEELGLPKPPVKSKKTGKVSSGKKALDWLSTHAQHPVIKALEEWRAVDQLQKAFLGKANKDGVINKGLMSHIDNGRLYTTFRMTLETGRNSSSPNLQNLPVLSKGPIRELFIAEPGNFLVQADYSQIELRIAAYESKDYKLIEMLESGQDIHTYFARALYGFEPDISDKEWKDKYDEFRTLAKRFTFGRLFGQSTDGMALVFNISREEAGRFQEVYSGLFPNMATWWDNTINLVRSGEPLITVWGRERRFPAYSKFADIKWRGKQGFFSHMDREALNFIPQGTAADVLSKATGNMKKLIDRFKLSMKLRLVVHDSLTVECAKKYLDTAAKILKAEMESIGLRFGWSLPVEIKYGRTWASELGVYKL